MIQQYLIQKYSKSLQDTIMTLIYFLHLNSGIDMLYMQDYMI